MADELDYAWHLREMMAARGMFSTTDLTPLLAERGVKLSASQVYRLVVDKPERLSMKTLVALLDILECRMEELIEPIRRPGRRRATGSSGQAATKAARTDAGLGSLRPKRARIVIDPQ
ncbi:helix-turn-helix domain-containing protein [Nocardia sp. NPDC058658]|uniref:helix-turn-helix domain-containing protein n=1 Tax=Nocardia sp. NPDC058658 TaxID=3346580 RepID=UPI003664D31A